MRLWCKGLSLDDLSVLAGLLARTGDYWVSAGKARRTKSGPAIPYLELQEKTKAAAPAATQDDGKAKNPALTVPQGGAEVNGHPNQ